MTQRASIFEGVQIGVEVTPGTAVAANKLLQSISIQPGIKANIKKFRPMGRKFASLAMPGKEWVEAKVTGMPTYDELPYVLASLVKAVTPVAEGTLGKKWTFSPTSTGPDTVKTYTVEQGSSVRAHKFAYGLMTGTTFNFTRDEISLDGSMLGRALDDGITLTATPTAIPAIPVLGNEVSVYLADTYAGLTGATAGVPMSASWGLTERFSPFWALNAAYTSFVEPVESEPKLECKLKLPADAAGMALLATMRTGATKFLRIEAVGAEIEATKNYRFTIDTAVKVMNVSEFSDEDGVFAIEWTFEAVDDPTWGKATELVVVNTLASL